ncbi:MAG: sodium:calcium antiporter [Patescibacteria group bacterium]
MTIGLILLLFILVIVLIKSADQVVIALRSIGHETHTKVFILSAILLAIATSFPELFVGITSALQGTPNLSLGNVLGANIANISLVAGLSALVVGKVYVDRIILRHELWIALAAGLLPFILIIDGNLSRIDGLILLACYGAYAASFFKDRFLQIAHRHRREGYIHRFLRNFNHPQAGAIKAREMGRLFVGLAFLLFSSDLIVRVSLEIAHEAGIPIFLIGLILLSLGTTLPELAFSLRSLEDKEPTMFFGNLLGSIIANSTLIVGLAATISPIQVANPAGYIKVAIFFVVTFMSFWLFIRTKFILQRWEGAALVLVYLIFVVVEFL